MAFCLAKWVNPRRPGDANTRWREWRKVIFDFDSCLSPIWCKSSMLPVATYYQLKHIKLFAPKVAPFDFVCMVATVLAQGSMS